MQREQPPEPFFDPGKLREQVLSELRDRFRRSSAAVLVLSLSSSTVALCLFCERVIVFGIFKQHVPQLCVSKTYGLPAHLGGSVSVADSLLDGTLKRSGKKNTRSQRKRNNRARVQQFSSWAKVEQPLTKPLALAAVQVFW